MVRSDDLCFTGGWWLGRPTVRQNPVLRPVNRCEAFSRFAAGRPGHGPEPGSLTAYQPPPQGETTWMGDWDTTGRGQHQRRIHDRKEPTTMRDLNKVQLIGHLGHVPTKR